MAALPAPLGQVDIQSAVDRWHESVREPRRAHLGLSLLSHRCDRYVWLSFRWAIDERFPGRILRLFRRGHREEETIADDLRHIGIRIHHTDGSPEGQARVSFGCHVSGSVDGIIESGVPGAEKTRHIAEFKTHSARSFREVSMKGVYEGHRRHWWQMQGYMLGTGIDRALYVAVCKDNDEMYTERIHLDRPRAEALIARGKRIALAERMPEPVAPDPSAPECRFCAARDFCFSNHLCGEVNCRTCAHVTPTEAGEWVCEMGAPFVIATEKQRQAQSCHVARYDLVPWRFLGGSENGLCARYVIGGKEYLNGAPWLTPGALSTEELLILAKEGKEIEVPF